MDTWIWILMILGALALVVGGILLIAVFINRYKKVPPDQAMVIYGGSFGGKKKLSIISGGGAFVLPVVQGVAYLPLDVRTLEIVVTDIITEVKRSGAKLNIKAVTQIKLASDAASLRVSAEQLLNKTDSEINEIATKTLEGHVRGICATMTIESINSDRDSISEKIQEMAARDLRAMGIDIKSFVIKEIEDEYGYLDALGRRRTAEVKRDARIGEANANKEAIIKEAEAARIGEKANSEAEAEVAIYHQDRDITKQKANAKVEGERANKEISFDLQDKKRRQELVQEEVQIDIVRKQKQIELQEKEIDRKDREQEAIQVVPAKKAAGAKVAEAEGERKKIEILAEAEKEKTIRLAEGTRSQLKLVAEGERDKLTNVADGSAAKITKEGSAEANIIQLKGQAEAEAIRAKGIAEAEAMQKKADAWKQYGEAAVTQMIVEQLPDIVKAASAPLEGVDKVIVLGSEGPAGLVDKTVSIAAEMPVLVKSLTGMDIRELVSNVADITKKE